MDVPQASYLAEARKSHERLLILAREGVTPEARSAEALKGLLALGLHFAQLTGGRGRR